MKMIHPLLLRASLIGLRLLPAPVLALIIVPWVHGADAVAPVPTGATNTISALKPGTYKLARAVPMEILEGDKIVGKTELSSGDTVNLISVDGDKGRIHFAKSIEGNISLKPVEGLFVGVGQGVVQSGSGPKSGQAWTVPGLNLTLQPIPAGTFLMGSPAGEIVGRLYLSDEEPQTRVTISHAFWMGKYVVTQGQWKTLMGTDQVEQVKRMLAWQHEVTGWDRELKDVIGNLGGDYPIYSVSRDEAMAFCQKLTARERAAGRLSAGYVFTLPTEAQWEYACRAGTTEATYAGKMEIKGQKNAPVLDAIAWYKGNDPGEEMHPDGEFLAGSAIGPKPVGGKQPNAWGLYDMLGNVAQWCVDAHWDYPGGSVTDPTGPPSGGIVRGSSWGTFPEDVSAARRWQNNPHNRLTDQGFRVVLAPVPPLTTPPDPPSRPGSSTSSPP